MASRIYGLLSAHPKWAASAGTPAGVPFNAPSQDSKPWPDITWRTGVATTPRPTEPARVLNKIGGSYNEHLQLAPWFEMMHVQPKSIDLGRVLSTITIPLSVHNAYRRTAVNWTAFVNGAGAGTSLSGSTPPRVVRPQASVSQNDLTFTIETDGVPVVDDELGFVFSDGSTLVIPIKFSRLVFFSVFPQEGLVEELGFLTDVLRSKNGTEKRASLRRVPRVRYKLKFRNEDGTGDLVRLHHLLLGRPGATFGIPLWHEGTVLTAAQAAGDASISVRETDYRQFVAGGVAVVFAPGLAPDIFQISSLTNTTITPVNPMVGDFPAGTLVMPVRLAKPTAQQRGSRWPVHLGRLDVVFDVLDILADLTDLSAWGTFNSKTLVDDCNAIGRGSVRESIAAELIVLDNDTGVAEKYAPAPNGRFLTTKQWAPQGIVKLWKVRALLYALRGQQTSFYMPTDRDDLVPIADLTSGSDSLAIQYAGVGYVFGHGYRDWIRVHVSGGTVYDREIIAVSQNEAGTEEYLQLGTTWPAGHAFGDVERVEFIQNVRLSTDTISLRYEPGRPGARVTVPLTSVLGE